MICENAPRYGVVVVVVAIIETKDTSEIEKIGVEISDIFINKFITVRTNVQIFLNNLLVCLNLIELVSQIVTNFFILSTSCEIEILLLSF